MKLALFLIVLLIVVALVIYVLIRKMKRRTPPPFQIKRVEANPVISPNNRSWSSQGTFNPAVVKGKDGKIHMLYRALGDDGVSRLGYASSEDGVTFAEASPYPVFMLENPRKNASVCLGSGERAPNPSGGGWSGCEDPRMVSIDGRIYVTFNAFDGWDFVRVGATSIPEDDFFSKKFKWSEPLLLSPQGQVHKNWVLFPEKIGGKFAILHSLNPEVQIDYVDRLEELSEGRKAIKSRYGQKGPRDSWDSWVRSAGPSPLKTDLGWLVLYHAVDKRYPSQYRLGALLLDLKDPKKIIARSPSPLLTPDMWYENDWKPGIIYSCGAMVKGDTLYVYYGGGDKYVCVARAPLGKLLDWLISFGKTR